jgi:hypothetical protein
VTGVLGTGLGFALLLAAGHGLLRLVPGRWPHRAFGVAGAAGLSWFAGVAALGALTTLVGVLGGPTRPLPVLAPVLALVAVAGLLPWPARGGPDPAPVPGSRLGDAIAGGAALTVTAWVGLLSARIPVSSNDEYALWMLKARALSQLGDLDPRVFTDTGAGYQHQTYPLFLPSLFGWLDGWAGRPTDAAAHLAVAVTFGALLAVSGAVLTRVAGPAAAAAALLLIVSVPTLLSRQSLQLVADLTVFAFAFCLALVLLQVIALPREQGAGPWLAAAAVLGAGAIGTKAEGLAFTGTAFAVALLVATGRRRGVVVAGAAALAVNLPWFGYTRQHHLHNWVANQDTLSSAHLRDVLPWTDDIVSGMVRRWPGGGWLGLALVVAAGAAAVLAVRAGRWRLLVFVAAVVVLDTAGLVAQYVVTAYGPPSDPLAGPLLQSQLQVTVYRVALLPATLLAVAAPVLAGLALRATATATATDPDADRPRPVAYPPPRQAPDRLSAAAEARHAL